MRIRLFPGHPCWKYSPCSISCWPSVRKSLRLIPAFLKAPAGGSPARPETLLPGETRDIACDGLFVAIGLIPENEPFKELADLNSFGYFDSDEGCLTKTPGLFIAGDCRSKAVRQVTTAAADGATAALAACRYINGL